MPRLHLLPLMLLYGTPVPHRHLTPGVQHSVHIPSMQYLVVLCRESCHKARFAAWCELAEMAVLSIDDNRIFTERLQRLGVIDFAWLEAIQVATGVGVAQQDDARRGEAVNAWTPLEDAWSTGTIFFRPAEDELNFVWEREG